MTTLINPPGSTGQASPRRTTGDAVADVERSRVETIRRSAELARRIADDPSGLRVLTGDRPTGPLHLGHLFGSVENRIRLQDAGVETMIILADYQVITDRDAGASIRRNVREIVCDHLAAGLDPLRSTMFTHSAVPELNQLLLPFLSLVSVAELQRNPTVKAETAAAGITAMSGLMQTYPVHQAADIIGVDGSVVPVGLDQLPHLEITRLIVRRFTERYGPALIMPEPLLSKAPVVLGTDGDKMSKSRGNAIALSATADETAALITRARTDSERRITYDPVRRPEVSNLVLLISLCTGAEPVAVAERIGDAGAGALKRRTIEAVNAYLEPLRARRREFAAAGDDVLEVVRDGNIRARAVATATLERVRGAMGMTY